MKKNILLILCVLAAAILPGQKMVLRNIQQYHKLANHPYQNKLIQHNSKQDLTKRGEANYNRLLVILVDFALEETDDPNTTGNGTFQLQPDSTYIYSVGAPPHNREYFEANLEALKYYYLAVSSGAYALDYDVYPKNKPAYTLPKSLGYYNPPGASSELFVSRMEEYFKTALETADSSDQEIDFASYGHYMIIHSGSDWQHDIMGDTPSDLPSFFIKVGDGKEAVVDNGAVLISHCCNVPETISQDFYDDVENGITTHNGYGALNAVIAHEFSHSLGTVDLYNVYNSSPMVGVFDIMDSGGSGILVAEMENGDLVYVEGALPTLPGAFSRNLMFRDSYLERGLLKEFPDFATMSELSLNAVSAMPNGNNSVPHTYKIPLNTKEYILVENRNVDPDGDGGTAVFGALDGRVILYPTPFEDISPPPPTYEYDYLLPSFIKTDGSAIGGGILVWHINEAILYDEGQTDSDGNWVSNFDANTVNTSFYHKGVSVIEADGLTDLGSDYSMYWTGTPYEYFHSRKPVLDTNGLFVNWSIEPWKPELTATTKPPLVDSFNVPGLYHLKDIGNPAKSMSFKVESGNFDSTQILAFPAHNILTGPIINTNYEETNIPVVLNSAIHLIGYNETDNQWQDMMGEFSTPYQLSDYPLQKTDLNNDGFMELVTVNGDILFFTDWANDSPAFHRISFSDSITTIPLSITNTLIVTTKDCVYSVNNFSIQDYISLPGTMCIAAYGDTIITLGKDYLYTLAVDNLQIIKEFILPEPCGNIEPLIYTNPDKSIVMIFVMANSGNLYRIYNSRLELIFANHTSEIPGQLACSALGDISPVLFFGLGNKLYAVKADGTKLTSFPVISPKTVSTRISPFALKNDAADILYYPLQDEGYLAIDETGNIIPELCLSVNKDEKNDYLYYQPEQQILSWYYPDDNGKLYIHSKQNIAFDPILFAGYRNGESGAISLEFRDDSIGSADKFAYIYPNPVRKQYFKLNLQNYFGDTKLVLYDISGTLVKKMLIPESQNNPRDFELSTKGLASGVYIMVLENNDSTKRLKFAVEK